MAAAAPPTRRASAWRWLDDRLGIGGLRYPVPAHANSLAYTLGGITLASFVGLVVTGIYLAQFYDPSQSAHASVIYITDTAFAGAAIRSLHYWLSSAFVITLALHLVRTFATASFKAPREMTWVTGVVLLALAAGLLFSGTVLKQDQEAVEALEHNAEIADLLGFAGFWFSSDFTDNVSVVTRLYVAHVSILPLLVGVLLAAHMLLIKRHRVSALPWGSATEVRRREASALHDVAFTSHLAHIGKWSLVLLGVVLILSGVEPAGVGPAGVQGIEITKPPWYFLWLYPMENWFGLAALYIVPALLALALIAVPWLDRSPERDPRRRKVWAALAVIAFAAWVALTIYGAITVPVSHTEAGAMPG